MTDDRKRVKYEEYPCVCLTCGNVTMPLVRLMENDIPMPTAKCKKCSKTAYVLNLAGLGSLMAAVVLELVSIKADIFDLQCDADEGNSE